MPHKKAKASVRAARRDSKGSDLPPAEAVRSGRKALGGLPKGMHRILHAEKIREEYRIRKKKGEAASGGRAPQGRGELGKVEGKAEAQAGDLKIQDGEDLARFNKRVEQSFRAEVSAAMQASRRRLAQPKKQPAAATNAAPAAGPSRPKAEVPGPEPEAPPPAPARERDFAPRPHTFPLHDFAVAMEPPALPLPRMKAGKPAPSPAAGGKLPVTWAQKQRMEEERQKAIEKYRKLKERKLSDRAS